MREGFKVFENLIKSGVKIEKIFKEIFIEPKKVDKKSISKNENIISISYQQPNFRGDLLNYIVIEDLGIKELNEIFENLIKSSVKINLVVSSIPIPPGRNLLGELRILARQQNKCTLKYQELQK